MQSFIKLIKKNLVDVADQLKLNQVAKNFSVLITKHIFKLLQQKSSKALYKQFIPDPAELNSLLIEKSDPISDNKYSPIRGIVHRYPDRCLFTPVFSCPIHCRFCFRKEKVGKEKALTEQELENCYQYIANHPKIWEVILSGGDPLILKPEKLKKIILKLQSIKHVEIIRIHTRIPVVSPERITAELLAVLQLYKPIYLVLHTNHIDEFSPEAKTAIARIIDLGIPMLSQTVLLKGINDDPKILGQLMRLLVKQRIKPYYLHQPDLVKGTKHFRNSIKHNQQIVAALRGNYSGLCQPTYVLDIPGGHGKSPIGRSYITVVQQDIDSNIYQVLDYQGKIHEYMD